MAQDSSAAGNRERRDGPVLSDPGEEAERVEIPDPSEEEGPPTIEPPESSKVLLDWLKNNGKLLGIGATALLVLIGAANLYVLTRNAEDRRITAEVHTIRSEITNVRKDLEDDDDAWKNDYGR